MYLNDPFSYCMVNVRFKAPTECKPQKWSAKHLGISWEFHFWPSLILQYRLSHLKIVNEFELDKHIIHWFNYDVRMYLLITGIFAMILLSLCILVSLEDRYIIICSKSVLLYKSDMFLLLPATHNLLTRNWQRNTSLQSYFTQYLFFHDNIDMITSGQNEIVCLRLIIPAAGLNFEVQFEYEGRNELDKLTYEVMVLVWVWLW